MIQWGVIVGALIGWMAGDPDLIGFILGGISGAIAGLALRTAIRIEIRRHTAPLEDALARLQAAAGTAATAPPLAPAREQVDLPAPIAPPAIDRDAERIAAPAAAPQSLQSPERGEPNAIDLAIAAARGWLFGGNTIVRIGLIILFVGLSFLARWAAGAGLFPIELRLALVAMAGIALLGVGWMRRAARPAFALALQGAGVAILYLTAFAAAQFGVMALPAAFLIMIIVAAFGCALALMQNAQPLAAAAFIGGYAVPLLLGREGGPPLVLFCYYTLLNLAVLVIASRRSWRMINLVGFFATFGVAALWGLTAYRPADYALAQAFLIVSVLIYVVAAILYARNTPGRFGPVVDGTLLFGPALAGYSLQAGLVAPYEYGAAWSALGFGGLYMALAAGLGWRDRERSRLLIETLAVIGIGFITFAVPLALGARWTGPVWAVEGAAAFWLGMRQARWVPRMAGLTLQAMAALMLLGNLPRPSMGTALFEGPFLSVMLVALPILSTAWWLRAPLPRTEGRLGAAYADAEALLGQPVFIAGFLLWCIAFLLEIDRLRLMDMDDPTGLYIYEATRQLLAMLAIVASGALWAAIGRAKAWPVATWPGRATVPILFAGLIGLWMAGGNVLDTPNWAIWMAAIGLHAHLLYRDGGVPARRARWIHAGGVWLAGLLLADCLFTIIDWAGSDAGDWAGVLLLGSSVALLAGLTLWSGRAAEPPGRASMGWPIAPHGEAYYWLGALPIAVTVYLGALATTVLAPGDTPPLSYLPLFNPVDLVVALAIGALVGWRQVLRAAEPPPPAARRLAGPQALAALAGLAFVAINMIWLRTAHHWLGVAWDDDALLDSYVVQTGLAILWTVLALALMIAAHRRAMRPIWLAGAGLLGLVVAKLALIDLSNADGGERIVTFIVVGMLMLVVGYFAPLPPRPVLDVPAEGGMPAA